MRNRLLRSVLGAVLAALVTVGVSISLSGVKSDTTQAVTEWPAVAVNSAAAGAGS
ncbi:MULTISPECIES: hypothetical protein [unclassified Streptomyces]|uniref:hypothetical protein n=1 Tax=unclassified Streptomyces TaxID=2593676 RepID=UPI003423A7FB